MIYLSINAKVCYFNFEHVARELWRIWDVDGEETWYRGDDNDMKAKAAFEALLRLRLSWPSTDVFETFSNQVKKRALESYGYDYGSEKVRQTNTCHELHKFNFHFYLIIEFILLYYMFSVRI